jgi:hypothetical protein
MNAKHIWLSKTFWLNAVGGLTLVLTQATDIVPASYQPYLVAALAVLNIANRFLTDQPVKL